MKTKFIHSEMAGVPTLEPTWGSMYALLKAMLTGDGYNPKTAGSIAISNGLATIQMSSGHGFEKHQIIVLSGATENDANTEYVVEESEQNSIKIKAVTASITGTVTVKGAGLGWSEIHSGTHKGIFKPKDSVKNPFLLRVDNSLPTGYTSTWAKFARVTFLEGAVGIDDFTGFAKAPQLNGDNINEQGNGTTGASGIYGWAKWYHGVQTSSYLNEANTNGQPASLDWVIVGDDANFWFFPQITDKTGRAHYGFCKLNTQSTTDVWAGFLSATEGKRQANQNGDSYSKGRNSNKNQWASGDENGKYLLKPYYGEGGSSISCSLFSLNTGNNTQVSGRSSDIPLPNKADNSVILHFIYVKDESGIRGTLPIIKWINNRWSFQDKMVRESIDKKYVIVGTDYNDEGMTSFFAFELEC